MAAEAAPAAGGEALAVAEEGEAAAAGIAGGGGAKIALVPPCRLVVKATAGARVIGKKGESIKAIRAASGASVKVLQDELPEALHRRQECIVLASCGEASALRAALAGILDRVFDRSGLPDPAERDRERPYVVDVIVPERASSLLVGPGGERIKALIDELGCDLNVVREPLAGIAAQKRVRILARERPRVDVAVWRLQEILAEFLESGSLKPEQFELREAVPSEEERSRQAASGEEVPIRILLAQGEAATVVGKMGANVMRLRDIAHVSIDDAEAPPFDASERVCFIARAPLGDRARVVRHVLADLCEHRMRRSEEPPVEGLAEGSRPVAARVLLPSSRWQEVSFWLEATGDVALGEAARNALFRKTGAAAKALDQGRTLSGEAASLRAVHLSGAEEDVAAAVYLLHQALEPWEPSDMPPRPAPPAARGAPGQEEPSGGKRGDGGKGGGKGSKGYAGGGVGSGRGVPQVGNLIDPPRRPPLSATQAAEAGSLSEPPRRPPPAVAQPAAAEAGQHEPLAAAAAFEPAPAPAIASAPLEGPAAADAAHRLPAVASAAPAAAVPAAVLTASLSPPGLPVAPTQVSWAVQGAPVPSVQAEPEQQKPPPLLVAVPSDAAASFLASEASGVAQRAGVRLNVWPASEKQGPAVLEICGPPHGAAVATYLVQMHLCLASALGSPLPGANT